MGGETVNIYGRRQQTEADIQNIQSVFCKNCGHKIPPGGKFCPGCGTTASIITQQTEDTQTGHGLSYGRERHRKFFKWYYAGAAGIIVLAAVCILIFTKFHNNTSRVQDVRNSFNKEYYKDSPFSKKQVTELEKEYKSSYDDEMKALDAYILAYMKNYDEYGDIKEEFENLTGITEKFYQAVNEYDPELKNVLADEAAYQYGKSPLSSYMAGQGVGIVLSDSEFGRGIRGVIEAVGLGILESLAIKSQEEENNARKDAMIPVAFGGDFAFVRSYGTIGQMLGQIERDSGYIIADEALSERKKALKNENVTDLSGHWGEDIEKDFNICMQSENYKGRTDALEHKKKEWKDNLYQWKSSFLTQMGIENADDILKAGNRNDEDEDTPDEYYTYIDEDKIRALEPYVYSIIDKKGKVYSSFLAANGGLGAAVNENGMCSVWAGTLDDNCTSHIIMDKEGNTLFSNDEKEAEDGIRSVYYNVTPNGSVLKKTFMSDYEHGDYQVLEYVKPDGNSKKLLEAGYIDLKEAIPGQDDALLYKNPNDNCAGYYQYESGYKDGNSQYASGIINMSDGELITQDQYDEIVAKEKENRIGGMTILEQLDANLEDQPVRTRLNEKYLLGDGNTIYDNSGKAVKELNNGRGVKNILYASGQYWVITISGWFYILDDNFDEVLKPVEIPEGVKYCLTEYGLLAVGNIENESGKKQESVWLYNDSGGQEMLSVTNADLEIEGFMANGGKETGWINLYTKKAVLVSAPEKPISLRLG